MFGAPVMLAQVAPSSTTLASVLAAVANGPRVEITRIVVANQGGSGAVTFQLCHDYDADGSPSFGKGNALWWDKSVTQDETFIWEAPAAGCGIPLGKVGEIGFAPSAADALTLTIYGVSAIVQERGQER